MSSQNLSSDIEFLLDWLEVCHQNDQQLKIYQGIEPFHTEFIDILQDKPDTLFNAETKITELKSPLDITLMFKPKQRKDLDFDSIEADHALNRVQKLDHHTVSRKFHKYYEHVVRQQIMMLKGKDTVFLNEYLALINGEWICMKRGMINQRKNILVKEHTLTYASNIQIAIGIAKAREESWRVLVGREQGPSVSLATDPTGIRSLFKMREIPEGMKRRPALRHWVSEHWRRNRNDNEDTIFVRRHLRGKQVFQWDGLKCSIIPSVAELNQ